MPPWHNAAALLPALVVLAIAAPAQANGRFPAADQLIINLSDPAHLVLRATYGIVQSTDAGKHWSWICEVAIGYGGTQDPAIGVTKDGTILAGVYEGLSVSHDRACSWALQGGLLAGEYVPDTSVERANPSRAVAITATAKSGSYHVLFVESLDDGQTWTQPGVPLPNDLFALTIDVAPSAPQRIYVSGLAGMPLAPVIERSDNRGTTWTRFPLAAEFAGHSPYLAAVDPNNPDRVYLRLDGTERDSLLVSTDGAQSFTSVYTSAMQGDLFGFSLSPDGSRIALGGPDDGLLIGSALDHSFLPVSTLHVRSLTWAAAGLYVATDELVDNFTLTLSTDDGKTFSPLYRLREMCVLSCPTETSAAVCSQGWPSIAATLGADVTCGQGTSSSASASASSSGGFVPRAGGDESCGCRLTGAESDWPGILAALGLGLGTVRRRRRRAATGYRLELPSAKSTPEISVSYGPV